MRSLKAGRFLDFEDPAFGYVGFEARCGECAIGSLAESCDG
jgi:hypothetical protein